MHGEYSWVSHIVPYTVHTNRIHNQRSQIKHAYYVGTSLWKFSCGSCLYARMNIQKCHLLHLSTLSHAICVYNIYALCYNTRKTLATCPVTLVPFLYFLFVYNCSYANTPTVNWYRSLYIPIYIVCVHAFYQGLVHMMLTL